MDPINSNATNTYSGIYSPHAGWIGAPPDRDPEHLRDVRSSFTSSQAVPASHLALSVPHLRTVARPGSYQVQPDIFALDLATMYPGSHGDDTSDSGSFFFLSEETRYKPAVKPGASTLVAPERPAASAETSENARGVRCPDENRPLTGLEVACQPHVVSRQSSPIREMGSGKREREHADSELARLVKRPRTVIEQAGTVQAPADWVAPDEAPTAPSNDRFVALTAALQSSPAPQVQVPAITTMGHATGPDRPLPEAEINRALLTATDTDETGVLKFLIDAYHPNLDAAMLLAARNGRAASMRVLLERGGNIHASDEARGTPLMWVVSNGRCDMASMILARAPEEINRPGIGGSTVLHHAVHGASADMVLALLKLGANPNVRERRGYNALHLAMLVHSSATNSIAAHLVKFNVDTNAVTNRGETFLLLAASSRIAVIPPTLEAAASRIVNVPDHAGRTPLIWACTVGNGMIVRHLLKIGASKELKGPGGKTARDCAVESRNMDLLEMLD